MGGAACCVVVITAVVLVGAAVVTIVVRGALDVRARITQTMQTMQEKVNIAIPDMVQLAKISAKTAECIKNKLFMNH